MKRQLPLVFGTDGAPPPSRPKRDVGGHVAMAEGDAPAVAAAPGATTAIPPPEAAGDVRPDDLPSPDDSTGVGARGDVAAAAAAVAPKTIPTSMAKLLQDDKRVFDVVERYSTLWPRPAKEGEKDVTPYAALADTLADISGVSSRLECVKLLTCFFLAVQRRSPSDLLASVYLSTNSVAPAFEGVELGVGDAVLMKVVAEICGLTDARLKEEYRKTGDLAEVAQAKKQRQCTLVKPRQLLVQRVYHTFKDVARMTGKDVVRRRSDAIKALLRDSVGPETNLIVRALQQKMRIGLAEPSVLLAVGYAFALDHIGAEFVQRSSLEAIQKVLNQGAEGIARIYHEVPSLDIVLRAVQEQGFDILEPTSPAAQRCRHLLSIRPGLPVRPQLAHPTSGITVILDRFKDREFTCEYKYDGERAQIHYDAAKGFEIFSRNSETHTQKYVDVVAALPTVFSAATTTSFIVDSEIVAMDPNSGALQAFQVLQHRGRKNVDISNVTIPVCVFAFDLMYLNGESLLHLTLRERRERLHSTFEAKQPVLQFAEHINNTDPEEIQVFLDKSIADGCEGLMVKTLDVEAAYTPAKRSRFWLKLKKDYMDGVTDTVDLVPIGAYYGKGKRTGVYGGFLLACYDPENDEYQSICKLGTGFQDDVLESITRALEPLAATEQPRYYRSNEKPDVWLTEGFVWEVKAADLSVSPVHLAAIGLVDPARGIALRFPRFLRVRDDKKPTESTSATQIAEMYRQQSLTVRHAADDGDEED